MSSGWRKAKLARVFSRKSKFPPPATKPDDQPSLDDPITMDIGGNQLRFESGAWKLEKQTATVDAAKLVKRIDELEGENKLLKFKVELLVDMLTLANLDYKDCEKDLVKLQDRLSEIEAK